MPVEYSVNPSIDVDQFIDLLARSTLAERRPVEDRVCMQGMVDNSNLMICAWHEDTLIGIARSMTDFHYACYMSDLAVDQHWQKQGIGRRLIELTRERLQPRCNLILISAPQAEDYYPHLGFGHNSRCYVLGPEQALR